MDKKRNLKKFTSQADYESQKDSVMGIPHVVLLKDTRGLVYKPKNVIDYSTEYFTIVALEDGLTVSFSKSGLEYKVNSGTWNTLGSGVNTTSVNTGDKISFRGNLTPDSNSGIGTFTISKNCSAQGNIMSLLFGDDFEGKTDLTGYNYAFNKLLYQCSNLIDASNLILPATTLTEHCYGYMFRGCTSLVNAPALPATTLESHCYYYMFYYCSSLTVAPELPATTLAEYCYDAMFMSCESLTVAPELPATTLASGCYRNMFYGCTSLVNAPELPATTLASGCYRNMFEGCSSLTVAPTELPATILAEYCYDGMFYGCTGLTTAPELPATTLASQCYLSMFKGCSSLTSAPELPATTLAEFCYSYMFDGCGSLTTAPTELPATTLADGCYSNMFKGCSSLNHITMLATDISASSCLSNWVDGVASSGTFVKSPSMTSLLSGTSGIPTGWEINNMSPCIINSTSTSITFNYTNSMFTPNKESIDLSKYLSKEELLSLQPLCDIVISLYDKTNNLITSDYVWECAKTLGDVLSELSITTDIYDLSVVITEVYEPEYNNNYYYLMEETLVEKDYMRIVSLEDNNTITFSQTTQYSINGSEWKDIYGGDVTVNTGDKVYLKNSGQGQNITSTKNINVEGNIMSLLFGDDFEGKTDLTESSYVEPFRYLFSGCTTLTDASNLILPATKLTTSCYYGMFQGCTSLTTAPELPATTLASQCYSNMFSNCTSLTVAPVLPATTLASQCYLSMFKGCSSLNHITMLATNISASYCLTDWVRGVASSGVFVKSPSMTSLLSGTSGIPTGWTVQDYVE